MHEVNKDKENPVTWVSKSNVSGGNGSDKVIDQGQADERQAGEWQQIEHPSLKFQTHHQPTHSTVLSSFLWVLNVTPHRSPSLCSHLLKSELLLHDQAGWEQQVEKNWTDTKRLDKALHPHLGGREPGERRVPIGSSRRKRKNTPSKIWKMPKTKFPDFQINFLDLAQGWVPGTFLSFIINYSWMNMRHVLKS